MSYKEKQFEDSLVSWYMDNHRYNTMLSNHHIYFDDDYPAWVVDYNYGSYAAKVPDRILDISFCSFCCEKLGGN